MFSPSNLILKTRPKWLWTEASLIIVLSKYKYQFLWNYEIFNVRCVECKWWFNMLKDVIGFIISSIGGILLAYSLVLLFMSFR